jgi:hypothetical protein
MRVCLRLPLTPLSLIHRPLSDEFADVKAVKLLRRGRRLQQVEYAPLFPASGRSLSDPQLDRAIYGKVSDNDFGQASSRLHITIPQLQPEFFSSAFWRWFSIQRTCPLIPQRKDSEPALGPLFDPNEFPTRLFTSTSESPSNEVAILSYILAVWAASFGLDERGNPLDDSPASYHAADSETAMVTRRSASGSNPRLDLSNTYAEERLRRKHKTDSMVREILELIDSHGILRKPSWDGVRALLLLLPLLEGKQDH